MIDPLTVALHAASFSSPLAYPLLFAAGVLTSAGPCVAPRYVAVAALGGAARNPRRVIVAFAAGIIVAYVTLGSAAGSLGAMLQWSALVYAVFAAALAIAGLLTLVREPIHDHLATRSPRSLGGTFLLGASTAFVASPCCTPIVAGIAGVTTLAGRPLEGAALMAAFAAGHVVPIVAAGALSTKLAAIVQRVSATHAPSVVAGTLMLALGAYYGALA